MTPKPKTESLRHGPKQEELTRKKKQAQQTTNIKIDDHQMSFFELFFLFMIFSP